MQKPYKAKRKAKQKPYKAKRKAWKRYQPDPMAEPVRPKHILPTIEHMTVDFEDDNMTPTPEQIKSHKKAQRIQETYRIFMDEALRNGK